MSEDGRGHTARYKRIIRMLLFPAFVTAIYGILIIFLPGKASVALRSSGKIFINIGVPLCLVCALMVAVNLFLDPARITKFLGRTAGIKGIILSVAAGIISTGPIYVWYPLLRELREKGARNSQIAIFLGNRAVKPILLPVMISYFGGVYVLTLTLFIITGSLAAGYLVDALVKE